ncbi:cell division protein FtsQ/DivIB [Gracilibacillus marinus]|jgi:cell division protein FtsQ|uniref:Cell division protein DivIB n=1 Tax=Gracilibacillus marinus TaxID=630535 RepID=A0ABV8VTH0_9BACI
MEQKRVVSIEDRIPQLKKERRKKANRKITMYVIVFFLLLFVVIYLQSPLSYVKSIDVEGEVLISEEEIITLSDIDHYTNFWGIQKKDIQEKLEKHPQISEVNMEKKYLTNGIILHIKELNYVGNMQTENGLVPLLENGNSLTEFSNNSIVRSVPLLVNFDNYPNIERLAKELNKLPRYIHALISEIQWAPTDTNQQKLILFMTDGYQVEITARSFADLLTSYPSIVNQLEDGVPGVITIDEAGAVFTPFDSGKSERIDKVE